MAVLAEELSSSLGRESRFFMGTERSEIQILTQVLEDLNSFLRGADAKSIENLLNESVKIWLEQTKDECEEFKGFAEEKCLLKLSKVLQERRIVDFLSRATRRFSKLNSIRSQASVSPPRSNTEEEITSAGTITRFFSFVDDYVDSTTKDVVAWLMDAEPERSVLSLVAQGGIDYTALARKVYDSETVQDHFDCFCWVDVSMWYDIPDHLKAMIVRISQQTQKVVGELKEMLTTELFGVLRQALEQKRYMIVLDNVSKEFFWHVIKHAFPNNHYGSRIIIITNSDQVANSTIESSFDRVHKLESLSDTASWDLFCGIAFQDEHEMQCPKELKPLTRKIIGMCRGSPILISGIAGMLSNKEKLESEWKKLQHNLRMELAINPEPPSVTVVLSLSYRDLLEHLIQCFLYFSIFPEDYLIPNEKLFKLWIAEGFVEETPGKTLEEVAKDYLNELVLRDLVQPCKGLYGLDQFCQVNRLIHNFARDRAEKLNFCQIWRDALKSKSRRVSIWDSTEIVQEDMDPQVQSIFLFDPRYLSVPMVSIIINTCPFVTMLDFESNPIQTLPEELGNLFYLKYLNLKSTKVKELPNSVQKLQRLQTLDVRNTLLIELPVQINKLKSLRHLSATNYINRTDGDSRQGVKVNKGIGKLENLQTLMTVDAHRSGFGVVKEMAKLKQLRALCVSGLTVGISTALCTCIEEFGSLESLTLQAMNNDEALNLHIVSTRVPLLQHVVLKGMLQQLPEWIPHLRNLSTLCLSLSRLIDDPLRHLSHLPNLESLWLYRAFEGKKLCFEEGSFEKLKLLVIRELRGLKALEIEDGALSSLEELRIGPSPVLDEVPSGIQYLRNLNVLASYDMPHEYAASMWPDVGLDYWKVEHIPSIVFLYRIEGNNYKLFKLGDSDFLDHLQGRITDGYEVSKHESEYESSFCGSDDAGDDVGEFSFSSIQSIIPGRTTSQWSMSSGFYTDDFEE